MSRYAFRLVLGLTLSLCSVASAADLDSFHGTWAMRLGTRNLFVLRLMRHGDTLDGTLERPSKASAKNGQFSNIGGDVKTEKVVASHLFGDKLLLTVQSVSDPKDTDQYAMTVAGDRAFLTPDVPGLPPGVTVPAFTFERTDTGAKVATDWDPNHVYTANDSAEPSAEMRVIFDEDQRVRSGTKIDWKVVSQSDAQRREQTRRLIVTGGLHTGKDYEEAAFVFQHGDKPGDYLLAHTLAMIAVSQGDLNAMWIATATLDRYLQNIGQKQIYGTQYSSKGETLWTQEPYDRELITDALREQLGVPSQSEQEKQLKAHQAKN